MDSKRRPPPIPEKTVAGMPAAKPPFPGPLPTPPTQLESQVGRLEGEAEAANQAPSNAEGGEQQGDGGANERFDPPVGGQFTSPAVAIMDPMKKQARRKNNLPPGYPNQQQTALPPGASPSQMPAISSGYVGKGASAASPNGVQGGADTIQQSQPAVSQPSQKHLRSPSVKRAPGATVTMQGWLHKQGSDGLMLWKRRWFVLSEFCLFYYKGPEEEKILGSILLPSYVISPCAPDEPKRGGHRKHSFKAEHHNMRTYYFAADSLELMERWMHNMNLASLLQRDFTAGPVSEGASWDERQSGRPSVSSFSSLLNQSADDSDSGFHGGRSPKHATMAISSANPSQSAIVPTWATKGKKLEEETISELSRERDAAANYRKGAESTPEVPSLPAEFQPLYANAPPKPRRLNSGGRDYSTSPERSPERKAEEESGVVLRLRGPANEPQQNGMYVDRNQRISRPMVSYASIRHERNSSYQQQSMQVQHPVGVPTPNQMVFPVMDRRTPDTYGRSNTGDSSAPGIPKMVQSRVDYEDVYSVSHSSDPIMGRMNRWSSGPYENQHLFPTEVHPPNVIQQQSPHVHLCPPSGHSPQQGHQQHTHGTQLGVVQRMPISHPYSVSPTTAQHQHPPLMQQHPKQQLLSPQPQPPVFHRRTPPLPRPHSADFLGHYDHNQMTYVMPLPPNLGSVTPVEQPSPKMASGIVEDAQKQYPNAQIIETREQQKVEVISGQQIQRPKSSMDIRPVSQTRSFDPTDYWSEESYARMMRQSLYMHAHHVHPSSSSSHKGSETSSGMGNQQLQNWSVHNQEVPPVVANQSSSRLSQISQKQQPSEMVELRNKGMEDAAAATTNRQSAPPGKRDMHQGGHFLRSASARMPRSRYHSGDNQREQSTVLSAVPGEEIRNGERKMQQREESMRRLLEWKQRMLQSPLTRKSSSSSTPRKPTQDPTNYSSPQMSSSHYKQMVLKQLANQEAAATTNNWEHGSRRGGNRRGPDDVRSARSRSHDGRRSSASLSRYNSYSSDDEEALGESRKRVRRGPQAGRGRRGTGGGEEPPLPPQNLSSAPPLVPPPKPPQSQHQQHHHHHHQHHKPPPQTGGVKNEHQASNALADHPRQNIHHRDRGNYEGSKSPSSPEPARLAAEGGGIPPDASYADVESSGNCVDWHPATRWEGNRSAWNASQPVSPPEKKLHFEDEICKRGREIRSSSKADRAGNERRGAGESQETARHTPDKPTSKPSVSFSICRTEIPAQAEGRESREELLEVRRVSAGDQLEYHNLAAYANNGEDVNVSKLKSRKTLHDLRSRRENPPKNIVQNRIKEFEPRDLEAKDGKKHPPSVPPEMKEPINPSPSTYKSNEAHVYPLRNKDAKKNETEGNDRGRDIQKPFERGRRGAEGGGAVADVESSDEGTSSPPPPLPASSPPSMPLHMSTPTVAMDTPSYKATPTTKSVRELLADFERKSEQKKKMEEEEETAWDSEAQGVANAGGGRGVREQERFYPGRRYVFSDTETLLYDTGSDLDEDSEIARQWKASRDETIGGAVPRAREETERKERMVTNGPQAGEAVEEGDSEVESALGRRNRFGVVERESKTVIGSEETMEVITTPGYLRLSLAESLVTHEDLVSPIGSSADATPPPPSAKNPAEEEEHYMPMTPSRKSILASPSSLQTTGASPTSASHSVIMESVFGSNGTFWAQLDEEESSYVEMTEEGLVKSLLVSETLSPSLAPLSIFASPLGRTNLELCRKSSGESTATYAVPESPSYTEIPGGGIFDSALGRNQSSHYELLSRATTQYEPVYMEVRSVKEGTNAAGDEANRLAIKGGRANLENGITVAGSEEERVFRKEKRKKAKLPTSDKDDSSISLKCDEFGERKSAFPSDNGRLSLGGILPDILSGSSQANQRRSLEEEVGTESSDVGDEEDEEDADDEASKDLDSLDAPRHPRFSLSDTFRPASYYLGASDRTFAVGGAGKGGLGGGDSGSGGMGLMNMVGGGVDGSANELHGDSSDSDLVSPPPIPTSPPPPLDDDEDVLGESIEDSDDKKSSTKTLSGPHLQPQVACKNLPSVQRTVISPTCVQPDGSSMSDISDTASTVCSLRRRPVTGNILDSLINSASNKSDIPSELYNRRNEILNEYGDYKRGMDFDTSLSPSLPPELWPRPEDGLPSALPNALHRRIASADDAAVLYENVHVIMKPRSMSNTADMVRPPLPAHRSSSPFVKAPENPNPHNAAGRVKSPETVKVQMHVRGSSQDGEASGAPYYYSDLLRSECEQSEFARSASERGVLRNAIHPCPQSWRPSRIPLNNQRDDVMEIAAKRNDVGRKVNRIQPPVEPLHAAAFRRIDQIQRGDLPPDYPRESCEGVEKLMAADLLLIGADKRVDVDERNIYETDTLKKASRRRRSKDQQWETQGNSTPQQVDQPMPRRCYTPDSLPDSRVTRNIYPYGLTDKSSDGDFGVGSHEMQFSPQNGFQERANRWRRRSRSLEGLLDDENESFFVSNPVVTPPGARQNNLTSPPFNNVHVNSWDKPATPAEMNAGASPPSVNHSPNVVSSAGDFNGADPWNEDNLWRESLRRVSLRHTRSLDHLDDCSASGPNPTNPSGRRSVDLLAASVAEGSRKSRVSRGVTYVNDRVAVASERRNRIRPVSKPPSASGTIEESGEGSRTDRRVEGTFEGVQEGYERYHGRQPAGKERSGRDQQPYAKDVYECDENKASRRSADGQKPISEHFLGEDAPPTPPQSPPPDEPGPGFEIDREKLRQWDLMSSAPLPGMAAGAGAAAGKVFVGGRRGAGAAETGGEGRGLPRADETVARGEGEAGRVRGESESSGGQAQNQQQESRMAAPINAASGSGSIREPAPIRHSKNDPSSTMLIISQPTSIPIQSPTYVQPPNARLGVPQMKQHTVQPHGAEGEGEGEGKRRQWRGNEGMVSQTVPMLRWEREGVEPLRRPQEDTGAQERDFHGMQRQNASSPKHDVPNGGGGRGRKGREMGEAEKAGERRRGDGGRGEVSVSAGDLLGRTHEELVLLLIQLRRQSAAVSNAIDLCQADLSAQARLAELEVHRRVEHLKKLEELKKHLLELEKQYEKGKPLINLVDNMVKLGSLYRGNTDAQGRIRGWRGTGGEANTGPSPAKDRLQFNQRVQEQRLLAEERRDWSRLSPDHGELQAKVQQLYRLDRLLQEESVTIQSLQQDKELLEKALGGLRHKLQGSGVPSIGNLSGSTPKDLGNTKGMGGNTPMVDPVEAERYRKQQRMLERELSRVRQLLAQNSKKLEETVAENARLEQELVVLRQKLQLSRRTLDTHPTSQSASSAVGNQASPGGATASLEAELRRVQSAVGDLQRQRHELSVQVRQLTEKSHSLVEQIRPGPTGVAGAGPIPAKKRHHSTWMETDLDSMESMDCGVESPGPGPSPSRGAPMLQPMVHSPPESTPLYVNTALGQHIEREEVGRRPIVEEAQSMANGYELAEGEVGEEAQGYQAMDINEADDRMKRFYGIIPREKPEIKTVRIVKRESERRQRDRTSKRVVLVDDSCENPCAASSSSLNRVLEEEMVEGEEEEETMAYHAHQQQSPQLHNVPSSVPFSPGFLSAPEDDPILSQFFQRSMSLPRVLGKQRGQPPPVPPPPPLRVASPRGSSAAVRRQQLRLRSEVAERPRSAHEQLFGTSQDEPPCLPQPSLSYSVLPSYSPSPSSHSASPTLYSPTDRAYPPLPPTPDSPPPIAYKSEAAREIALEMAALHSGEDWADGSRGSVKKRATPKEKRRHYTVSCSRPLELESIVLPKMGSARSRDDLDMEQVLRPRLNAPDVVRSTMSHRDFKYNEHTIDSVLGTPNKIVIPERYIPEQAPELSEEEQMQRLKKVESIRKMLSETTPITAPEVEENQQKKTSIIKKKVAEEKRQRDHILQLNQILAKQVMEKSKMVAVRALATLPLHETSTDEDDLSSPVQPLPLTQQRDNFFS